MTGENKPESPEWAMLAQDILGLWQDHLATLAADPKAKAEMAQYMAPSARLFAEWADMVQHGVYGNKDSGPAKAPSASAHSGPDNVAELARRLARLERRLGELEARVSPGSSTVAGPDAGAAGGREG
ncbi:MAG: hypothetical protein HGA90_00825 [Alphaproteobacteria bacterium]|nr:hypothetical protein [Alphaproteobacteria bacterium]